MTQKIPSDLGVSNQGQRSNIRKKDAPKFLSIRNVTRVLGTLYQNQGQKPIYVFSIISLAF